ncbi:hypothetical protein D3C78_1016490 [compost metagenome]
MKMMTEFSRNDPILTVSATNIVSNQRFRQMISVTLRCINQVNTKLPTFIQNSVDITLAELLTPFSSKLPRPNSNNRYIKLCFS